MMIIIVYKLKNTYGKAQKRAFFVSSDVPYIFLAPQFQLFPYMNCHYCTEKATLNGLIFNLIKVKGNFMTAITTHLNLKNMLS